MKVFLFLACLTEAVKYKDCGTSGIQVQNVDISPCSVEPCELHHGQSYRIDIHFIENVTDELSLELCGYVGPVCVPFPIKAPIEKVKPGKNTYSLTMPIEPAYPSMKVVGKVVLKSKQTENKVCILVPLKIMPDSRDLRLATIFEPIDNKIHQVEDKWMKVLKKVQDDVKAEIVNQL